MTISQNHIYYIVKRKVIWDTVFKKEPSKIFEGCVPQILLGPFLNTLSHIMKSNFAIILL